jgi:hypothetical protein
MTAEENRITARQPQTSVWYVIAALFGIAVVFAYDVAMFFHYQSIKGWGWVFFYVVPACAFLLGAFLIGRAVRETRRSYWIRAVVMSAVIPGVVLPLALAGTFIALLYALFWPEWGDRCDIGRTDLPCYAASQNIWQSYGDVNVSVRFGGLSSANPNATVVLLQHSKESPSPDVTDIAIRLGAGPYRNLSCDIEPLNTNNGWYRRTTCPVADPKWLLSPGEPDTLTVRFNVDQSIYERNFNLLHPRRGFAQMQKGSRDAKSR